jgi:hypothetical protein
MAAETRLPAAFGPGEQATYRLQFLGLTAAIAQVTVGAETSQWGQEVWPIVTTAHTEPRIKWFPVRDMFVTFWEPDKRRTIGSKLLVDENHRRRKQEIQIDHEKGVATVVKQSEGAEEDRSSLQVPNDVMDVTSATFALREHPFEVGASFEVPVYTGRKLLTLKAHVEGRQTLSTVMGARDVFRVRIQASFTGSLQSKGDLVAYVAADATHLPVYIEAPFVLGKLVAELTDYQPGAVDAAPARR